MAYGPHGKGLWRNPISFFGIFLAIVTTLLIITLLALDYSGGSHSTYLGIITFMVLPGFLVLGGAIFLYGMWREHRITTVRAGDDTLFPILDLNAPRQRFRFSMYFLGGIGTLLVMAVVSYEAYHYTESVSFCGTLCHPVMTPEYRAFQRSPHARVLCADCHIGGGANWYVKSKLSGLRQVWATIFGTYQRPIPTPIHNLRPARETCEECHWPNKFYGGKLFVSPRYAYDEKNTSRTLSMLVLIGGEGAARQGGAGIHWHMLLQNKVTYQPADDKQQVIAKVWSEGADGKKTEYSLAGAFKGEGSGRVLELDCVTCHNRPSHIYYSPEVNVDAALLSGKIDATLPNIKRKAVELLTSSYADEEAARAGIEKGIQEYYAGRYPELARTRSAAVTGAVAAVQEIFHTNFFPAMKVSWRDYPNNIGHRDFPGCFRCHDGKHLSAEGKAITRDCTACHTLPALGPLQMWSSGYPTGQDPWHPWELRGKHYTMDCDRCHDGGLPKASTCSGCHQHPDNAPMADMNCGDCHKGEAGQARAPQEDCKSCHDDLTGLHRKGDHKTEACVTCHPPHLWTAPAREACFECHEDKKEHHADKACSICHPFKVGKK